MVNEIHQRKTVPRYFQQVKLGAKTFDLRKNDREYKERDFLLLKEFDNGYTNNEILCKVTHVLYDYEFKGIENGYCVMSIKLIH